MLAAAALRLAAIEALCPYSAVSGDDGVTGAVRYPTLARNRVYDTRAPGLQDLDRGEPYTPCLSLYSAEAGQQLRGPATDAEDIEADCVLDLVAELSTADSDGAEETVGVMADDDPEARLVLEALVSQCLYVLHQSEAGGLFRRLRARLIKAESVGFAVPQYGLRFQRITTRLHYEIRPDRYPETAGELPEPMATLYAALPKGSYSHGKLCELARHFNPDLLPALEEIRVTSGPVTYGHEG